MKIYTNLNDVTHEENAVLSIGTFDGFHIGHRKIISTLLEEQKKNNATSYVLTFSNHPYEALFPDRVPDKIGTIDFKVKFLQESHINNLILIEFDSNFADISHIDFLKTLRTKFKKLTLVLGSNFKFGKDNLGSTEFIKYHIDDNLKLVEVPQVLIDDLRVSSSRIRNLIKNHDIQFVNKLLDRDFFIDGVCIEGDKLGRKIGFPTINILNRDMAHPKQGVYKTQIEIDDKLYDSMTFIGDKSIGTQDKKAQLIETHVFNFNDIAYGKQVTVYFKRWIREQIQMNSLDSLKKQLEKDKMEILSSI